MGILGVKNLTVLRNKIDTTKMYKPFFLAIMVGGIMKTNLFKDKTIKTIERFILSTGTMRQILECEIQIKDEKAVVSNYEIRYIDNGAKRVLIEQGETSYKDILKLLNKYKVLSWDGFKGKHPKNVADGTVFTLEAVVNEDRIIYATGSQNFPKDYHEVYKALREIMQPVS